MGIPHPAPIGGSRKERNRMAERKGNGKSSKFDSMAPIGNDSIVEEVSGNQVNVATRHVNLSDILGDGAWGNQNQPDERSIIIDT